MEEAEGATIPVRITKDENMVLANPVTFRLTPLTVDAALERGIISEFPVEDPRSPNRASKTPF